MSALMDNLRKDPQTCSNCIRPMPIPTGHNKQGDIEVLVWLCAACGCLETATEIGDQISIILDTKWAQENPKDAIEIAGTIEL